MTDKKPIIGEVVKNGIKTEKGTVCGIDTSMFKVGDKLAISPTNPGDLCVADNEEIE